MNVFVIGYPGAIGGANTECWHTVKLWRRFGAEVTLVPTWSADPAWKTRLAAIGCRTVVASPARLERVPGLAGATVVSFCNRHFLRHAAEFRRLGCRVVWLGCMNWLLAEERLHYRACGPFERYVFQSRYQQEQLLPALARYGVQSEQCRIIRGAFCADEFPFRPRQHDAGTPLVLGRISRAAPDKFSAETWSIYGRIRYPIRARVLGWEAAVQQKLGPPPGWAECLAPGAESPPQFLQSLHVMVQVGGQAVENWPRSGLEAMASGVPIVAENRGGWPEMIRHGQTGLLADDDDQLVAHVRHLAEDEPLRQKIAAAARCNLEERLAEPVGIWRQWHELVVSCQFSVASGQ
jgi:hypothetical protein